MAIGPAFNYVNLKTKGLTLLGKNGAPLHMNSIGMRSILIIPGDAQDESLSALKVVINHVTPRAGKSRSFWPRESLRDAVARLTQTTFEGSKAARVLSVVLAATNGFNGTPGEVRTAVSAIEGAPGTKMLFDSMSDADRAQAGKRFKARQAEEIAAIADGLFVSDGTNNKLDAMRD
ncbi:MAG: hypothetical protein ABJB66_10435 [Gemmatimonadaceae bacterium]